MTLVASAAIVLVTLVNCAAVSVGGRIASVLATLKVSLVLGVGVGAFILADGNWAHYAMSAAGGACEGVPAAARGGHRRVRRRDARRDVGLQRLERGDATSPAR